MSIKGSVRSSQLITTYGVGAMVAAGNESFIVAGIDRWERNEDFEIHEPRLEKRLGVQAFMKPPSTGESNSWDIPVLRFPRWHSCPACHRLDDIRFFGSPVKGKAECGLCETELVPSRFVVVCESGHLDDFPYFAWVHKKHEHPTGTKAKLSMSTKGESAGLRDVLIECDCGAKRTLEGAFGKKALQQRCKGGRPWLGRDHAETCTEQPRTVQRGASSVWFAQTQSAISIPPWSDSAFRVLDRHWAAFKFVPEDAIRPTFEAKGLGDDTHTLDELVEAAKYRKRVEAGDVEAEDVKGEEYLALMKGAKERGRHDQFVCVPAENPGTISADWIPTVHQVQRLREVRVLTGFSRLTSVAGGVEVDGEPVPTKAVSLPGPQTGWLPALEIAGEGVFLELTSDRLRQWEAQPGVVDRVRRLAVRYRDSFARDPDLVVSPRLVLVHTLAHVLIDQWALESGYSAAALTERLYVGEDRAGVLIYTATSDSAGSLGGVVAMTDEGRLDSSLAEAVKRASWCSADPLCIETATQGAEALNLAACHACALLPETSCEHRNSLLDRALLVGTADDSSMGFFSELL